MQLNSRFYADMFLSVPHGALKSSTPFFSGGQLYNGKVTKADAGRWATCLCNMPAASPFQAGLLKFLGIEEKTCDVLTGEFCNEEQLPGCDWSSGAVSALCLEFLRRKRQLTSLSGKSPEELGKLLEAPLPFGILLGSGTFSAEMSCPAAVLQNGILA